MFVPARGSGGGAASAVSRGWPHMVLWRLGGFFLLLLLEGARCLTNPSNAPGINNNNRPNVNVFMSEEEVKKLLGVYYVKVTLYFPVCSTLFLLCPKCWLQELFGTLSNKLTFFYLAYLNSCPKVHTSRFKHAHKLLKLCCSLLALPYVSSDRPNNLQRPYNL